MTRYARRVLGVLLSAALLSVAPLTAGPASSAPVRCTTTGVKQDIKKADVVFRGVVAKAGAVRGKRDHRTRAYRVQADRVYKSSLVTRSVTVTAEVGTACAPPRLNKGTRYLFFVIEDGSRLVATPATAKATHGLTGKVVKRLGNGGKPHQTPAATAEFSKVADASPPSLSRLLAPGAALVIVSLLGLLVVGRMGRRTQQ